MEGQACEGKQDLEHGAMAEQAVQGAMEEQALARMAWREQALAWTT